MQFRNAETETLILRTTNNDMFSIDSNTVFKLFGSSSLKSKWQCNSNSGPLLALFTQHLISEKLFDSGSQIKKCWFLVHGRLEVK